MASTSAIHEVNPSIFSLPHVPLPSNAFATPTLTEQAETEHFISDLLSLFSPTPSPSSAPTPPATHNTGADAVSTTRLPALRKGEHAMFLSSTFFKLPAAYVSLDASRPWLMFWSVHSLDLLGVALDQGTKDRWVPGCCARHPSRIEHRYERYTMCPYLVPARSQLRADSPP
jgi:protein farnesyltransferase subunit beta